MSFASRVRPSSRLRTARALLALSVLALGACADDGKSIVDAAPQDAGAGVGGTTEFSGNLAVMYECTVVVDTGVQSCRAPRPSGAARTELIAGKAYVTFITTGAASSRGNATNEDTTVMNVAIQNLMNHPIGTLDGTNPAPAGNRVFFHSGPTVTAVKFGTLADASARMDNPTGIGSFSNASGYSRTDVPFYQYDGVLVKNAASAPKLWRFVFSANTKTFSYRVYVAAPVQYESGRIAVSPAAQVVEVGATGAAPTATSIDAFGATVSEGITWSSSDPAVATVDAGTGAVKGVALGTATITATSVAQPSRKGTLAVTVVPAGSTRSPLQVMSCRLDQTSLSCGANHSYGEPYVQLTGSGVTWAGGVAEFNLTVQNLLTEAIGTRNGVVVEPDAISLVITRASAGMDSVLNHDGTMTVGWMGDTHPEKPYFRYAQMLQQDEVSAGKTIQLAYAAGATSIDFEVYLVSDVQALLVINEVLVNPAGTTRELAGDWFEVYNAGRLPVQMQDMLIADSAASGRQPYHKITSSLVVASGAYVVFGSTASTVSNGGVPVDYAYGAALSLPASLDAIKISRLGSVPGDTLTLDRTQYASSSVSGQDGVSRELKNPALDNSNMDGSNWGSASVTAVYGAGGRGTPRAQNSAYTP